MDERKDPAEWAQLKGVPVYVFAGIRKFKRWAEVGEQPITEQEFDEAHAAFLGSHA